MAFVRVGEAVEVPEGEVRYYDVDGVHVALCNVDGDFYAIDDVCTHDGGPLDQGSLQGNRIECPRHGAQFDVTTGRAVKFPAVAPVRTYDVRRDGDNIEIDVDV
jgi:3-phenylpropionate/trans-cinnamate dioxygenase ferredoxin subunit